MNIEQIVDNRTPMAHRCIVMVDRHGRNVITIITKMTWGVSEHGVVSIASPQSPVRAAQKLVSEAPESSIHYPSDIYEEKPGTDVLLVGTAQPPPGAEVTRMDVGVRIETGKRTIKKTLHVYGPRVFQWSMMGVVPGPAAKLQPTALIYENAYGGTDMTDPERPVWYQCNPVGRGFAKNPARLVGLPAPSIEDPDAPLTALNPAPACFGAIRNEWLPRIQHLGTYDEEWRFKRAPLRPVDFSPHFYRFGLPDLWADEPLVGHEPVEVLGTSVAPIWRFRLPRYAPQFTLSVDGLERELPTHLDTYFIDADKRQVEVTFRATAPMPRKVEQIGKLLIMGAPKLDEALIDELAARVRARRSKVS